MTKGGRAYLLVALFGLVLAVLLSALAAYLSVLLVWVLVEMLWNDDYSFGVLFLAAPFYLAAAAMPFWGVLLFWSVLCGPVDAADRRGLRRSGWRLLSWSFGIFLALTGVILAISWPDIDDEMLSGIALMAGTGLFAVTPLLILLRGNSTIGPNSEEQP